MTSLDFQSLLKQEKALRRAELKQQHDAPKKKVNVVATDRQQIAEVAATPKKEDDRTDTPPWFVELAERPLLEMDKARLQDLSMVIPSSSPQLAELVCDQLGLPVV